MCDNIPCTDHDAVKFVIEVELCFKANIPPQYLYDYSKIILFHMFHGIWLTMVEVLGYMERSLSFSHWSLNQNGITIRSNTDTISLIHKKQNYTKLWNWVYRQISYHYISNLVHSKSRADAITLSNCFRTASKKFWQWVNAVKRYHISLPSLLAGDVPITDDCATKADLFNCIFIQFSWLVRYKIYWNPLVIYHPSYNPLPSLLMMFSKNYYNILTRRVVQIRV